MKNSGQDTVNRFIFACVLFLRIANSLLGSQKLAARKKVEKCLLKMQKKEFLRLTQ